MRNQVSFFRIAVRDCFGWQTLPAPLVNEGRFSCPYIPTGIYTEARSLSNLQFQTQEDGVKAAPLPEDIRRLGAEGVNQTRRDAKLKSYRLLKELMGFHY